MKAALTERAGMENWNCLSKIGESVNRRDIVCTVVFILLITQQVHGQAVSFGSSPNKVGSGARAMGQGNAFIAVADDATAASWNPAGIIQLERPEISFAVEYLNRRSNLTIDGSPESSGLNETDLTDLNYFSIVYPFYLGRPAVFSLNYLKQYRFDNQFNIPLVETATFQTAGRTVTAITDDRYSSEVGGDLASLSPVLAVAVSERLSLGLAVNVWNHDLTHASEYSKDIFHHHEVTWYNFTPVPITLQSVEDYQFHEYTVDKGYSITLGTLFRLSRQWTFGAVAKPPYKLYLDHDLWRSNGGIKTSTQYEDVLEFPWMVGTGAAWRPSDNLTLSMDVAWTQWSEYELYTEEYNSNFNPVNPISQQPITQDESDDTVSVRMGLEYLCIGESSVIPLRCGIAYDPGPAVDQVDEYYTFSLGAGYQRGPFMIDIGYEVRLGNDLVGGGTSIGGAEEDSIQHRVLLSMIIYL